MKAQHRPRFTPGQRGGTPGQKGGTWAGRVLRGRRFDRNPLRRGTDRAETAVILVLLAAFGCAAWFGAHAAADWSTARAASQIQTQHATFRQVRAVLLEPPVSAAVYGTSIGPQALARWTAPNGGKHTGDVAAPLGTAIGSTVLIWVNQVGDQVTPLQPDQAAMRSDLAATVAVGAAGVAALLLGVAVHCALDRRRMAAWDADWLATGPRWRTRR